MRIVLLGPQGSGKGTQGQRLAQITGARHLASGDLVRSEIQTGTPLGREIQAYNNRGELVPDDIIVGMIKPYLTATSSWILDGFPRDLAQAEVLDILLKTAGLPLDRVIGLEAPDDVLIARMAGRRQSAATGKTYHVLFDPPPASDPGPFLRRADDAPEEISRRLQIYHTATEPLKRYYMQRGLLTEIDASGPPETVTEAILQALKQVPNERASTASTSE